MSSEPNRTPSAAPCQECGGVLFHKDVCSGADENQALSAASPFSALEQLQAQRITELESALQEIVRVATQPISSMRPIKRQLQERGQEMLDIARVALR